MKRTDHFKIRANLQARDTQFQPHFTLPRHLTGHSSGRISVEVNNKLYNKFSNLQVHRITKVDRSSEIRPTNSLNSIFQRQKRADVLLTGPVRGQRAVKKKQSRGSLSYGFLPNQQTYSIRFLDPSINRGCFFCQISIVYLTFAHRHGRERNPRRKIRTGACA